VLPALHHEPASQIAQGPPRGPENPGLHTQSVSSLLPAREEESAGHAVQFARKSAPVRPEYVAAGQDVHGNIPAPSL